MVPRTQVGSRGFTYLGVLVAIALMGFALVGASEVWTTVVRRQQMEQLEWVGLQFEQAIGSYYESSPGRVKKYPPTLDDLVEDKRFAFTRRHLRKVYCNPMSNEVDWELVRAPDGGIRGLRARLLSVQGDSPALREFGYVPGRSS